MRLPNALFPDRIDNERYEKDLETAKTILENLFLRKKKL